MTPKFPPRSPVVRSPHTPPPEHPVLLSLFCLLGAMALLLCVLVTQQLLAEIDQF